MDKTALGFIDCPTCGGIKTMRITHDKNKEPFGFCIVGGGCRQQLRVGGDSLRIGLFVAKYPWANPDTDTVAAKVPAPVKTTLSLPVQPDKPKKSTFADALNSLAKK